MRDGITRSFAKSTYLNRGKDAPKLVELKAAVVAHLISNPGLNTTLPQRAFNAEGWQLLYTPPYVPEVQPIELVWATVKHIVASQSKNDRTVTEARNQTEVAFEQLNADACLARITHCQEFISRWLRTAGADKLSQFNDFEDVVAKLTDAETETVEVSIGEDELEVE